jgi:four helix bundle protein
MQDFRHIRAWESAVLVAVKARNVAAKFPRRGYADLREQFISAAESISHNIAEGRAAPTPSEFLRFLGVSLRSASETASQLDLAQKYGIVEKKEAFNLMGSIICTRRMISSLQDTIRTDLKRDGKKSPKRQT